MPAAALVLGRCRDAGVSCRQGQQAVQRLLQLLRVLQPSMLLCLRVSAQANTKIKPTWVRSIQRLPARQCIDVLPARQNCSMVPTEELLTPGRAP